VRLLTGIQAVAAGTLCLPACADHALKGAAPSKDGGEAPSFDGGVPGEACDANASADADMRSNADASVPCVAPCEGLCTDGRCTVTLAEIPSPVDIAVDGANAYIASCLPDAAGGAVLSVPLGGGPSMTVATGAGCPVSLTLGDTSLYVAGLGGAGNVAKVTRGGGTLTTLASNPDSVIGIAVDDANVYWATQGGSLVRVALGGGMPSVVASCQRTCTRPVVSAHRVFWGDPYAGSILTVPGDGGLPMLVTSGLETVSSLAVGGSEIYFANGYFVGKAPLAGGAAATLGLPTGAPVNAIAVDDTSVYFTSWSSIWKIGFTDVQPMRIVVTQGDPGAIAVDSTSVYWTEGVGSRCGRVAKLTPK
jgi:hypothetical protein